MKNITLTIILLSGLIVTSLAQSPPGIPYQAIARTTTGEPYANGALQARFSLHEQTATGTVSYAETHSLQTDEFGLFSTTFGAGALVTGTFAAINWGLTTKYLQVEINLGNNWIDMGTQQLMSVPYAMYAGSAGNNSNTNNSSTNSNYAPSTDSVLTLIGVGTLQQGNYTVPAGEYWKIVSTYRTPGYGSIALNANFYTCSYFMNSYYRCLYTFEPYPIFSYNGVNYFANVSNSGNGVAVGSGNGGGPACSNCPPSEVIQTTFTFDFPIPTPFWLSPGETINLNNQNIKFSFEKYK